MVQQGGRGEGRDQKVEEWRVRRRGRRREDKKRDVVWDRRKRKRLEKMKEGTNRKRMGGRKKEDTADGKTSKTLLP